MIYPPLSKLIDCPKGKQRSLEREQRVPPLQPVELQQSPAKGCPKSDRAFPCLVCLVCLVCRVSSCLLRLNHMKASLKTIGKHQRGSGVDCTESCPGLAEQDTSSGSWGFTSSHQTSMSSMSSMSFMSSMSWITFIYDIIPHPGSGPLESQSAPGLPAVEGNRCTPGSQCKHPRRTEVDIQDPTTMSVYILNIYIIYIYIYIYQ